MADMISHVLRGELDPKIASTVGYLLSIQLKVKQTQQDEPFLPAMLGIRSEEKRVRGERQRRQSDTSGIVASHSGSRHPHAQNADVFPSNVTTRDPKAVSGE